MFKPAPFKILSDFIKGFIAFWLILIAPVAVALLVTVYLDLPWVAAVSAYGFLGVLIAILRSRKSKIEIDHTLKIHTVRNLKTHPDLLTSTLIINVIFAVQAVGMWFIFIK